MSSYKLGLMGPSRRSSERSFDDLLGEALGKTAPVGTPTPSDEDDSSLVLSDDQARTDLPPEDHAAFFAALDDDRLEPTPALCKAFKLHDSILVSR